MESSDSDESDRDEVQASQDSNSASVTVEPTGVTGPRVIKFGYKEFTVKCQRWHAACSSSNKRIQDKVNVTTSFAAMRSVVLLFLNKRRCDDDKCFHKVSVTK